jgi:cytoskeleton protein RodZ
MAEPKPERREAEDPVTIIMRELGSELRRARLKRGDELEDVARYLRLKPTYLYGLEQGDMAIMPGTSYALGFLRSYADYLGFDGGAIVARLKSSSALMSERPEPEAAAPAAGKRVLVADRVSVAILATSVVAGMVAGWAYLQTHGHAEAWAEASGSTVNGEPAAGAEDAAALDRAIASAADATERFQASQAAEAGAPVAEGEVAAPIAPPEEAAEAVAGGTGGPAAPAVRLDVDPGPADLLAALAEKETRSAVNQQAGGAGGPGRVVLRALDRSSIEVSGADGAVLQTRTLERGEAMPVPDRPDLELWTSNAGGIEILLDGKPLPPIGPVGTVIRGLSLDPARLMEQAGEPDGQPPPGTSPTL